MRRTDPRLARPAPRLLVQQAGEVSVCCYPCGVSGHMPLSNLLCHRSIGLASARGVGHVRGAGAPKLLLTKRSSGNALKEVGGLCPRARLI